MRLRRAGFSLIELMIAMGLGLLSIAAVGGVFLYGSRNYKQDDRITKMQDELRFGMAQITQDLEMAGFWAQVNNPVQNVQIDPGLWNASLDCGPTIDGAAASADNNWVFVERRASLAMVGNVATGTAATAAFPCITATEFHADPLGNGTDILAVKRLAGVSSLGTAIPGSGLPNERTAGSIYLRTNGIQSIIYQEAGTSWGTSFDVYEYRPVIWFIRRAATDNQSPAVPSLCRKHLSQGGGGARSWQFECLAQGIESLQFEYGFDGNADGVPDYYATYGANPGIATLANIIAVRVHMLARSTEPSADAAYRDQKVYALGGVSIDPPTNDRYYRRNLSTVVLMRNNSYRLSPFALPQ